MYQLVGALLVCFLALSFFIFMLSIAIGGLKLVLLWVAGAKDWEELGTQFDKWLIETRKRRIARGAPTTLRGALWVLAWRVWKAYTHPIRAWRGEFLYPPKKSVRGAGDLKP
jgi:hypothetical protein